VCIVEFTGHLLSDRDTTSSTGMGAGPVTPELRPPRLPHAQKNLLIASNRGESVVVLRCKYAFISFLLRPASFHHAPYYAQHRAGITLALRPLRLYGDQSDRITS